MRPKVDVAPIEAELVTCRQWVGRARTNLAEAIRIRRVVIRQAHRHGMTYDQIAAALGVTRGAVIAADQGKAEKTS